MILKLNNVHHPFTIHVNLKRLEQPILIVQAFIFLNLLTRIVMLPPQGGQRLYCKYSDGSAVVAQRIISNGTWQYPPGFLSRYF